jgi:hypothetical protein
MLVRAAEGTNHRNANQIQNIKYYRNKVARVTLSHWQMRGDRGAKSMAQVPHANHDEQGQDSVVLHEKHKATCKEFAWKSCSHNV